MKKKEITIKDLAEILFPKLWIVVIVSLLVSAFTFVYSSFLKDDTYTDSSLHYVFKPDNTGTEITTGDNLSVAQGMVEIYKVMLEGEIFLKKVVIDITSQRQLFFFVFFLHISPFVCSRKKSTQIVSCVLDFVAQLYLYANIPGGSDYSGKSTSCLDGHVQFLLSCLLL